MGVLTRSYRDHSVASQVVRDLEAAGVPSADISVMSNNTDGAYSDAVTRETAADGASTGAGVGATLGGAAGLLAGLGMMAIPGLGPVVAAGWLASTAVGAVAGGAAGGLIGALADAGVPADEAELYAEGLRRGDAMVVVRTADANMSTAQAVMDEDAIDFSKRRSAWAAEGWTGYDPAAKAYTEKEIRDWRSRGY